MKHAECWSAHSVFWEGLPNLQDLGKLMIGETVPEIIGRRSEAGNEAISGSARSHCY